MIDVTLFSCAVVRVLPDGRFQTQRDSRLERSINQIIQKNNHSQEQNLINDLVICILCGNDPDGWKKKSIQYYLSYSVYRQASQLYGKYKDKINNNIHFNLDELVQVGWAIICDDRFLIRFLRKYDSLRGSFLRYADFTLNKKILTKANTLIMQRGMSSTTSSRWGSIKRSKCTPDRMRKALKQIYLGESYKACFLAWECFNKVCISTNFQHQDEPTNDQFKGILDLWQRQSKSSDFTKMASYQVDIDRIKKYLAECIEAIENSKVVSIDLPISEDTNNTIKDNLPNENRMYGLDVEDIENSSFIKQIREIIPLVDRQLIKDNTTNKLKNRIRIFILFGLKCRFDADIAKVCGVNRSNIGRTIKPNFSRLQKDKFLSLLIQNLTKSGDSFFEFNDIARVNQILIEELPVYYQNIVLKIFNDQDYLFENEQEVSPCPLLIEAYKLYINNEISLIKKEKRNIPEESFLPTFIIYVDRIKNYIEQHHISIPQQNYDTLVKITHPLIDLWQRKKVCQNN